MVLTTMAPMSASWMPAAATALSVASSKSASAWRWKDAVRSSQPRGLQVPIGRLAHVSALDASVGKHARQAGQMREEARRRFGDGLLQNLVLWHGGRHRCDLDVEPRRGFGVRPARNYFLQGSVLPWKHRSFLPIDGQSRSLLDLRLTRRAGRAGTYDAGRVRFVCRSAQKMDERAVGRDPPAATSGPSLANPRNRTRSRGRTIRRRRSRSRGRTTCRRRSRTHNPGRRRRSRTPETPRSSCRRGRIVAVGGSRVVAVGRCGRRVAVSARGCVVAIGPRRGGVAVGRGPVVAVRVASACGCRRAAKRESGKGERYADQEPTHLRASSDVAWAHSRYRRPILRTHSVETLNAQVELSRHFVPRVERRSAHRRG